MPTVTIAFESGEAENFPIGDREAQLIAKHDNLLFLEMDLGNLDTTSWEEFLRQFQGNYSGMEVVALPLGTRQLKVTKTDRCCCNSNGCPSCWLFPGSITSIEESD